MILLKSKKVNTFDEKNKINFNADIKFNIMCGNIKHYENTINFEHLECSNCHSDDLIFYGSYKRNVVLSPGKSTTINIKRVKCKHCGKTHAIIPTFVKPYFQYESSFIDFVMLLITIRNKKNKELEKALNLYRQIIRTWKIRFKYHLVRLMTTYCNEKYKLLLKHLFEDNFIKNYYEVNGIFYFSKITNINFS